MFLSKETLWDGLKRPYFGITFRFTGVPADGVHWGALHTNDLPMVAVYRTISQVNDLVFTLALIKVIIKLQYKIISCSLLLLLSLSPGSNMEVASLCCGKEKKKKRTGCIELKFYAPLPFDSSPAECERLLQFSRRSIILEGQ